MRAESPWGEGLVPLWKEKQERWFFSATWRHSKEVPNYRSGAQPHKEPNQPVPWPWRSQPPELWERNLLFKPPRLWYFRHRNSHWLTYHLGLISNECEQIPAILNLSSWMLIIYQLNPDKQFLYKNSTLLKNLDTTRIVDDQRGNRLLWKFPFRPAQNSYFSRQGGCKYLTVEQ